MLDVDEHQRSGQETETHYHSRLNEPPLVMESNLTTGLGPSEMIGFNYEIIVVHQAHAICQHSSSARSSLLNYLHAMVSTPPVELVTSGCYICIP